MQLITTIHDIALHLNAGEQIDVFFLDFLKAFDRVPYNRLIHKLHYYGICGSYLEWIKQFLVGRTQQMVTEDKFSDLTRNFWCPTKVSSRPSTFLIH